MRKVAWRDGTLFSLPIHEYSPSRSTVATNSCHLGRSAIRPSHVLCLPAFAQVWVFQLGGGGGWARFLSVSSSIPFRTWMSLRISYQGESKAARRTPWSIHHIGQVSSCRWFDSIFHRKLTLKLFAFLLSCWCENAFLFCANMASSWMEANNILCAFFNF